MMSFRPPQRYDFWNIVRNDPCREIDATRQEKYAEVSQRRQQLKHTSIAHIHNFEAEAREPRGEERLSGEPTAIRSQATLVDEAHNHETLPLLDMDMQQSIEAQQPWESHERHARKMQDWFRQDRIRDGAQEPQRAFPELSDSAPPERLRQPPKLPSQAKLDLTGPQSRHEESAGDDAAGDDAPAAKRPQTEPERPEPCSVPCGSCLERMRKEGVVTCFHQKSKSGPIRGANRVRG